MKKFSVKVGMMKVGLVALLLLIELNSMAQLSFTELGSNQTGVAFRNTLTESPQINVLTYQYFHNGGGVSVGDINNDGLPDIYFTSNLEPNILYLNKGNFQFEDISATARVTGGRGWATGTSMVDINNDGFLDIYVCKSGNTNDEARRNRLYINNGDLTFTEAAAKYGLADLGYSSQAYFMDYDRDGDLDLFLLNHPIKSVQGNAANQNLDFERDRLAGDKFFRNDDGLYVNISEEAGIAGSPIGYGLSASVGDMNSDGYPDIYVCNDYLERDYLYINNADGTFTDRLKENTGHISNFSMGSDIGDINNDGYLDIMVADMAAEDNYRSKTNMSGMNPERFWNYVDHGLHYQYMINTLQLNNGDATFSEISQLAGVDKTDWSWAPLLADFDQDGLKDLFMSNGLRKEARNNDFVKRKQKILEKMKEFPDSSTFYLKRILDEMPEEPISNYLYLNKGDLKFSKEGNSGMETPTFSNGAAYADLDGDGDLDLVVNNIDQLATIYRNDSDSSNFIKIDLIGNSENRSGIGAKVTVVCGDLIQTSEHYLARGFQSSMSDELHFGIGKIRIVDHIEVVWSDGTVSKISQINPNKIVTIAQDKSLSQAQTTFRAKNSIETELSTLEFTHRENEFDDYAREVLLPHKMSNLGPAVGVGDANGDGLDDFYVGGAAGKTGYLYIQTQSGEFDISQERFFPQYAEREEVVAYFFDYDGDDDQDLYIGYGGNENLNGSENLADKLFMNDQGEFFETDILPESLSISTGTVISADYDQDGDLDLFIGSRQTPGKYPFASSSYLLKFEAGRYVDVTAEIAPGLAEIGMVTDAVWADLNGDKIPELVLSGEWMPVTIFELKGGYYINSTRSFGLDQTNGWWFSLEVGDIDNDGDLDLVAGNLGLNYKYKATLDGPFKVFSDDINDDGKNDIVLGYDEAGKTFPLRGRQCSSEQIPELELKFPTYDLFAIATISDVYGDRLEPSLKLEAYDFHSAVFINEGGSFKQVNFAHRFQSFNWNDIILKDINADGNLDVISAGNLYEAEVETPRCDAGMGLILLGDGKGSWKEKTASSGSWGNGNIKQLGLIQNNNKLGVLIGSNNSSLKLLNFISE